MTCGGVGLRLQDVGLHCLALPRALQLHQAWQELPVPLTSKVGTVVEANELVLVWNLCQHAAWVVQQPLALALLTEWCFWPQPQLVQV